MGAYRMDQWILFFFLYCFLGWLWESCFVSVKQRHWVNRGFLHGPLLPLYGSGALVVLLATLPVRGSLPLIYLLGMAAATVLEYFTGAAMETLFRVRYWDYTGNFCNVKGYICLGSSLGWGAFSVLLVRVLHPPVERFLLPLSAVWAEPLAFALSVAMTIDAVRSFQAAMDLRELLTRLTEENEDLHRLARRVEILSAFAGDDLRKFRERTEVDRILLTDRIEIGWTERNEAHTRRLLKREEALEESLRRRIAAKVQAVHNLSDSLEAYRGRLEEAKELTGQVLSDRRAEITEGLERLRTHERRILSRAPKTYAHSLRILRGNPTAKTGRYPEALEALRKLEGSRKK